MRKDRIRTFVIISPQNPLGWKDSTEEGFKQKFSAWTKNKTKYNKESLAGMKSGILVGLIEKTGKETLSQGHFDYIPIKGSYGDKEQTLFILNPSFKDAKSLARNYGQESFFFGRVFTDKPSEIAYYKTEDACVSYQLVEISNTVTDEEEAEDFFSKFGFKYKINMEEFGNAVTPVKNDGFFEESFNDEDGTFLYRANKRKLSRQ